MRKYKQVKRKEIIFSLEKWKQIEKKAASLSLKTGTFVKRMSLDGQITYYNLEKATPAMNAWRIIGAISIRSLKMRMKSITFTLGILRS